MSAVAATAARGFVRGEAAFKAALLGVVLCFPPPSTAAGLRVLHGHVPSETRGMRPLGSVDPAKRLNLAIGLPLHNSQLLTNLISDIYDPASPQFRHFLTPQQFAQLFAPTQKDYDDVAKFAQTNGFTLTQTHGNRVVLDVTASVAQIEKAFHIRLQQYPYPNEPRTFYAPDTDPSVDDAVPILDISGLTDLSLPRPLVRKSPVSPAKPLPRPAAGSGPGGMFRGNDFRAAYAPNVAANGSGETVGLLEFDGYYASDITSYESQAGLSSVPLTNVLLDGFNGSPGSANIEVALDIEVAIAMAPGLNRVIIYEAGPNGFPNDILSRMASDNLARQISSSWTWSGGPSSTTDNLFQQLAAQGQSFFQASGDDDAYSSAIPQPADSAYITVVGGTTLSTSGPGGAWTSEKTWNWFNTGTGTNGSSGGISTTVPIPTWQQTISMAGNQGSTIMRNIPDVALTADNIWITYDNGSSGGVGGTSCAAPLWAAYTALINQQALANGRQPVGFVNPSLYSIANGPGYASAFHDIATGNNTNKTSSTKFFAASGYDLCTGLGTPAGSALINALAGPTAPQVVSNSLAIVSETCANNAVDPGETVTLNFGLANIGTANTTNLVATLQSAAGLISPSAPQSYGVLAAGGPAVTRPFSFTASGKCGDIITATLQLQDGASNLGTVSFAVRLGAISAVNAFSENFDGVSAPALPPQWTSAVTSGVQSNWTTTNGGSDTGPNSVFAPDTGSATQTELTSPSFSVLSASAQLTFRHNYNLAMRAISHPRSTNYYDGGALQISIGGGAFSDILAAGGSFVTGGYNCTLSAGTANPLAGTQAWGGNSGGWLTTTVNLPASAAGQNVQLKWVLATGVNTSVAAGWFVDSISVQDSSFSCCSPNTNVPPGISTQPTNQVTNVGGSASFSVGATGSPPLSYQWNFGGVPLGGATSATLSLVNVQTSQAGNYSAIVSDSSGAVTSAVATLTVVVSPSIVAQPTNQTVAAGASVAFQVSAAGSAPLSYQWMANGSSLAGATASALVLNNVQANQAGGYCVIVTNAAGSITSVLANLTVLVPPSITLMPTNQTVIMGSNVTFQSSATGSAPLGYQWFFGGASLPGATTTALGLSTVQTNQAGNYVFVVTNAAGSATSAVARLTVLVPPVITAQPTNQTTLVGGNVAFSVGAAGSSPLGYQWMFNATNSVGANTNTFTLTNVQPVQAGNYCVLVTNAAGAVTSAVAILTVGTPPAIGQQPSSLAILKGHDASFSVTASGDSPLSYQWRLNGNSVSGSTTSSYTVTAVTEANAGGYDVVVANTYGSVTSAVAQLTVLVPPAIATQPTNQTIAAGGTANFLVTASGTSPLSYQWCFNATNMVGGNTNFLSLTNVQQSQFGGYTLVITNVAGSITSAVAILTIGTPPAIRQQPANSTVIQGQNAGFTLASSGDAPLSYQWLFNSTPIAGATAASYDVLGATAANAGSYDAVVSNAYGTVTSILAQLTVLIPPSLTAQPTNQVVVAGNTANFLVNASGTSPLTYQWWFNETNALSANTNFLTLTNAQASQAGAYFVVTTNAAGAVTSTVATLTVLLPPSIVTEPTNQAVMVGASLIFITSATGAAPLTYQWSFNGSAIPGATLSMLPLTNIQPVQAGTYSLLVSNSAGSATSAAAFLKVLVPPIITSPLVTANNISVQVSSAPDLSYLLEYKNTLQDPAWTPVSAWTPGTGGIVTLQDTNGFSASRFYRVRSQ
jgi:hypothetical protein